MIAILAVDDFQETADSVAMLCNAVGHDAHVAYSGPEAVLKAVQVVPHIIFLDLLMPGMDGFETAVAIRATPGTDHPFIIALTGVSDLDVERKTKAAGFDFHLTKPVNTNILLALVENLAGRQRPALERAPADQRIDALDDEGLARWAQALNASPDLIRRAVSAVGSQVASVRAYLEGYGAGNDRR